MEAGLNHAIIYSPLPLGHIRILDLLPGGGFDIIQVKLGVVCLNEAVQYKALSYTWGSAEEDLRRIQCNGHDFRVTANLFAALTRFRHTSEIQQFWVDAICINQSSNSERTQQVALMRDIFYGAEEVLVWLGPETPNVDYELLFRVATNRCEHAYHKRWILDQTPNTAVVMVNHDGESMRYVEEARRFFHKHEQVAPSPAAAELITRYEQSNAAHKALLVCQIEPENDSDTRESLMIMYPTFDLARVKRTLPSDYGNFQEYWIEATKPREWDLSDEDSVKVLHAHDDITARPYFQRCWIVQEIMVSSKATMVCGMHSIDFNLYWAVFGLFPYTGTGLEVQNFMLHDFSYYDFVENTLKRVRWYDLLIKQFGVASGPQFVDSTSVSQLSLEQKQAACGILMDETLAKLLYTYGYQLATDPRDHVFSLIGLALQFSEWSFEREILETLVDYSNKSVEEVFLSTAKYLVDDHYGRQPASVEPPPYHILSFFRPRSATTKLALPSWVPDWTSKTPRPIFTFRSMTEVATQIPYKAHVDGKSLFIHAHLVDDVAMVSDPISPHLYDLNMFQEVDLCRQFYGPDIESMYGSSDLCFEAFWRTIVADDPVGSRNPRDEINQSEDEDTLRLWTDHCRANYDRIVQGWGSELPSRRELEFLTHVTVAVGTERGLERVMLVKDFLKLKGELEWSGECSIRRAGLPKHCLVRSKTGFFGLAPIEVQPGDSLFIIAGDASPWYLRKHENHYTIVGRAWVCGLMYNQDEYYKSACKGDDIVEIELR